MQSHEAHKIYVRLPSVAGQRTFRLRAVPER